MKKALLIVLALVLVGAILSLVLAGTAQAAKPPRLPGPQAPLLGVQVTPLTPGLAKSLGVTAEKGLVVLRVLPDTPAAKAGLKVKDVITAVDGTTVATAAELRSAIADKETVILTVVRGSEELAVEVALGAQPLLRGIAPQARFFHYLGGEYYILDKDGNRHTVKLTPGVVVEVTESSLTITPNGEQTDVTFAITENTRMRKGLQAGDRVTVVTVDGSHEASVVQSPGVIRGPKPLPPQPPVVPAQPRGRGPMPRPMMPVMGLGGGNPMWMHR